MRACLFIFFWHLAQGKIEMHGWVKGIVMQQISERKTKKNLSMFRKQVHGDTKSNNLHKKMK